MTQPRQLALFLIIGLIWGSEWIARQAIDAPPLLALALRYGLAALLLGVVVVARRVQTPRRRDVIESSVLGLTFLAIPAVLTLWAGQRLSPGLLLVILSMVPLLAVLLENRAAGVPLPLIGGVGGTALLLAPSLSFELTQLPGALAVLAAAVSIAGSIFYIKTRLSTADPMVLAASQFAASALALVAASLILEGKPVWGWTSRSLASEVVLALVANALAFPLYFRLLRRWEVPQVTSSQWLVTLVSVAEGSVLLRQAPSWRTLAGAALVAASLWKLLASHSQDEEPLTIQITRPPFRG